MRFYEYFLVGCGGALGSVLRAVLSKTLPLLPVDIPLQILVINTLGGLLIGVLYESSLLMEMKIIENVRSFCMTGFIGGFTTFSAFTLEAYQLIEKQKYLQAILYIILSVVLSLAFFCFGTKLIKLFRHY